MELVDPVISSTDCEVQQALRLLEAPIVIFAETAAERRGRLYKLMVERGYGSLEDIHRKLHANPALSSSRSQEGKRYGVAVPVTSVRTKEKFSSASPALVESRTTLLPLTMARAERRIAGLKEAFLSSAAVVRPAHLAAVEQLQRMRLTKSVRNVKMKNDSGAFSSSTSVVGTYCMPFTSCVAVSMFPHTVVTGAADGVMTLWDTDACLPHVSLSSCDSGWGRVQHLAAHPTKPLVFSTTMFDYRIATWRVKEEGEGRSEEDQNEDIIAAASGSGNCASADGGKRRRGLGLERTSTSDAHHTARIQRLAIDPTGSLLASTSDDSTVCLWDVTGCVPVGHLRHLLTQDGYETACGTLDVCFHPDGSLLSTTDKAGRVVTWDVRSGMHLFTTAGKHGGHLHACTCVSWSPCGVRFASGGADNLVHLWDARYLSRGAAEAPCILVGHEDVVTSVAFYANPAFPVLPSAIVSTSLDGTVRLWDADAVGVCSRVLQGPFPVRAQCRPAGGAESALLTVAHGKYWSLWDVVAEGEELEVIPKETEAASTMSAALVQNSNMAEEDEEEEDEMMLLRKKKGEAVEHDDGVSSLTGVDSDEEEDEMRFLKKK